MPSRTHNYWYLPKFTLVTILLASKTRTPSKSEYSCLEDRIFSPSQVRMLLKDKLDQNSKVQQMNLLMEFITKPVDLTEGQSDIELPFTNNSKIHFSL